VTTGAFFHHFTSKEDLGFAVINSHMDPAFGYGRAASRSGMNFMTLCLAMYLKRKRRCDG